jgi:uncharacterized protein (TIGR02147 family)
MPNIFDYLDYQTFLTDWVVSKKSEDRRYTKKYICRLIDCDQSFFGKILDGKKPISKKLKEKLAELINLKKKEYEYFGWLIALNKAKNHDDKKNCLDQLTRLRETRIKTVAPDQYEFYEKWYYSGIFQLLEFFPFLDDYHELARMLYPPIKVTEAKKAVRVLEKLKMIQKNEDGYYEKTQLLLSSGEGWKSVAIAHYQMENLKLAQKAFEKYSEKARRFSTLTLTISEQTAGQLLENLKKFEMDCLDASGKDKQGDRVYQFNFQAFPISQIENGNE